MNPEATRKSGAAGLGEAVRALYAELGTWQAVADCCNRQTLRHSAGYYQQIATGRIKEPSEPARLGIEAAPETLERLLKRDFSKLSCRAGAVSIPNRVSADGVLMRPLATC